MLKEWGIERVVIAGMMTHMCVDATARAAADFGFHVMIAEDACATRDLQYGGATIPADLVHKSFLAALKSYGRVMKTDEIIAFLAAEMVK
jgi:nicotinamidase-related amidase